MDNDDFDSITDSSEESIGHINEQSHKIKKIDLNFNPIKYKIESQNIN